LRNALRLSLGIAVSVLCLYVATRGTDWSRVGEVLVGARPGWVLGVVAISLVTAYIRAQRWRVLLRPVGQVPLYPALSATAIGFGATSVLPFRIGEVVRPVLLARNTRVPVSAALSSVVLERLFDMLLVITCALAVSIVNPRVPDWLRQGAYGMVPIVAVGFGLLVAMQRNRPAAERLLGGLLRFLPGGLAARIQPIASSFLGGLEALGDVRSVVLVLGYSAYLWGVITLTFLFSFLALSIDIPLLPGALTTVVLVAVAVFLPQAPGFVGTWQVGCVVALHGVFDVPQDAAVGYSLLTWIVQMVVNISLAGFFLAREHTSIGQLVRAAETAAPAEVDG
jgi:uncharacterized protein (TIRG00374 family)